MVIYNNLGQTDFWWKAIVWVQYKMNDGKNKIIDQFYYYTYVRWNDRYEYEYEKKDCIQSVGWRRSHLWY